MAIVLTPPQSLEGISRSIFLAGSIEMDKATLWQASVITQLDHLPITILNPRRADWDSNWKQDKSSPPFREQVTWELDALELTDLIIMYLDPKTQSPISLLELGLFAKSEKMIVCCPEGFWRKGNVDIVCERYNVIQVPSIPELVNYVIEKMS